MQELAGDSNLSRQCMKHTLPICECGHCLDCLLARDRPALRNHWDNLPIEEKRARRLENALRLQGETLPESPAPPAPAPPSASLPPPDWRARRSLTLACEHRGEQTRTTDCPVCGGKKKQVAVHKCNLLGGECTVDTVNPGLHCCRTCTERKAPEAAAAAPVFRPSPGSQLRRILGERPGLDAVAHAFDLMDAFGVDGCRAKREEIAGWFATLGVEPARPGAALKALLGEMGIAPSENCTCNERADEMDALGVRGCRARRDEIAGWLSEGAGEWGWGSFLAGAFSALTSGYTSYGALVDEAIRRAEATWKAASDAKLAEMLPLVDAAIAAAALPIVVDLAHHGASGSLRGLGDVLLGLTAVAALRAAHPGRRVVVVCQDRWRPWLRLFEEGTDSAAAAPPASVSFRPYTCLQPERGKGESRAEKIAGECGVKPALPTPRPIPEAAQAWARPHAGAVVIIPFTHHADRSWPLSDWRTLATSLRASGQRVIVISTKNWRKDLDGFPADAVLLDESAERVAALLSVAAIVVGPDTGPMHLAGLLRRPAVCLSRHFPGERIYGVYGTVRSLDKVGPADPHTLNAILDVVDIPTETLPSLPLATSSPVAFIDMAARFWDPSLHFQCFRGYGRGWRMGDRAGMHMKAFVWRKENPTGRLVAVIDDSWPECHYGRDLSARWFMADIADEIIELQNGEQIPKPPGPNIYDRELWSFWKSLRYHIESTGTVLRSTLRPEASAIAKVQGLMAEVSDHVVTIQPLLDAGYNKWRNKPVAWWRDLTKAISDAGVPLAILGHPGLKKELASMPCRFPLWRHGLSSMESLAAISMASAHIGGETGFTLWSCIFGVPTIGLLAPQADEPLWDTGPISFGAPAGRIPLHISAKEASARILRWLDENRRPMSAEWRCVLSWRQQMKAAGRQVAWTSGCFDLLHAGHAHSLQAAKAVVAEGGTLIVGVNSDESVRNLKGPDRPIIPQQQRVELLRSMLAVDQIVIFDETTPEAAIAVFQPDIVCKGAEYRDRDMPEAATVQSYGGRAEYLPLLHEISTSGIVKKIRGQT